MIRPPSLRHWAPGLAVLAALAQMGCGGSQPPATNTQADAAPAHTDEAAASGTRTPAPEPAAAPSRPARPAPPARHVEATPLPAAEEAPAHHPVETARTPAADAEASPDQQAAQALQWLQESEAKRADYQRRLAEASQQVVDADAKVAEGERSLQAFRNPYLPRPKLSEADAAAVEGKDGAERIQMAQDRLAELRAARDAAQKNLDDLKANSPN